MRCTPTTWMGSAMLSWWSWRAGRMAPPSALIMQRNNRRLFRVARAIVKDDSEAEDVVQEAYLAAFASLGKFRGDASLATWLTRITLNEALGRLRRQRPMVGLDVLDAGTAGRSQVIPFPHMPTDIDPERAAAHAPGPPSHREGHR